MLGETRVRKWPLFGRSGAKTFRLLGLGLGGGTRQERKKGMASKLRCSATNSRRRHKTVIFIGIGWGAEGRHGRRPRRRGPGEARRPAENRRHFLRHHQ